MGESVGDPSVLIVGSGPAGLFAAYELGRHGVKPRIVEQRLEPHHETRGTALQPGVLDVLDRAGLIEPFISAGMHIRHVQVLGPGMREIASSDFGGLRGRYEFQCCQPQWRTEQILRDHLARAGVHVEYGAELLRSKTIRGRCVSRLTSADRPPSSIRATYSALTAPTVSPVIR